MDKKNSDNRSKQLNPNNDLYWKSRGFQSRPENWQELYKQSIKTYEPHEILNRANQLNPYHRAYHLSRLSSRIHDR